MFVKLFFIIIIIVQCDFFRGTGPMLFLRWTAVLGTPESELVRTVLK
jgi:hypothetical protein